MDYEDCQVVEPIVVKNEQPNRDEIKLGSGPGESGIHGEETGVIRIFIAKQDWESRMKVPLSYDALIALFEDAGVPPEYFLVYANNNGGT